MNLISEKGMTGQSSTVEVSVVIPNRNGRELLGQFLIPSYESLMQSGVALEFIVVDGASSDGSSEWLSSLNLPNLRCVSHEDPLGYGNQINAGALLSRGEYILVLTTDVLIEVGLLEALLCVLRTDRAVGFVVPKILRETEGGIIESITSGSLRKHEIRPSWKSDPLKSTKPCKVLWPCGAVFLCRKSVFQALGGFAPEYSPAYSEDLDLGIRAWLLGHACVYEPNAVARHWHNSTTKKDGGRRLEFLLVRNHVVLNLKYLPGKSQLIFLGRRLFRALKNLNSLEISAIFAAINVYRKSSLGNLPGLTLAEIDNLLALSSSAKKEKLLKS